ncbi:uncharacterized protein [Argopecten irradians]|uniref:uncharacterized protein n=1 Tax=Argopecten irradians TaxID=31199 RepID=UPI0037175E88
MDEDSLSKDERLSDQLLNSSRNNDIKTFDKCIKDGANILSRNIENWNILHYIGLYRSYALLCHVTRNHPEVVDIINDVTTDGTTPLLMACSPNPPDIRIIEKFVRLGGDLLQRDDQGNACKDKTHDRNVHNFLQWRKLHPSGLPDTVLENQRTPDNDVIMKYLRTFAFMDDGFARRYEAALKERTETSANIRVIFLGPQGVGKTTMTYNLLELPVPREGISSTNTMDVTLNRLMINQKSGERIFLRGDDIEKSSSLQRLRDMLGGLSISENKKTETSEKGKRSYSGDMAYVNVFDFGGEIMFSNFQHIFLNADAVMILTFRLDECLQKQSSGLDTVYFWLKFMSTYSIGKYKPPVILVGTHLDKIPANKKQKSLETILAMFKSMENPDIATIYEQHVVDFIAVSNLNPRDEVYEKLWKTIMKYAPYQAQWGQLLPGAWISLEHDLMTMKSRGVKVLTLEEIRKRAEISSVTEVEAFLRYLHSARSILTFPMDSHQHMPLHLKVILDPEWMIKAFRLIVTEIKYHIKNLGNADPLLEEYRQTRRLKRAFIDHVWKKEESEKFSDNTSTLLYYIERSELIVKPLPRDNETDDEVDTYIVPSMLQDQTGVVEPYIKKRRNQMSSTLCIAFENKFIPDAIFDKFMASLLYRFAVVYSDKGELVLQRGLACFVLTADINMAVQGKDNMIKVALFSENKLGSAKRQAVQIRTVLERLLMSTLQRNDQGHLKYSTHLERDFGISGSKVITTSEATDFWFGDHKVSQRQPKELEVEGHTSDAHEGLNLKQLSRVARHISANVYQMFFIELGLDDTTINQLRHDNAGLDFRSLVTRILIRWYNDPTTDHQTTMERILDAMAFVSLGTDILKSELKPKSFMEDAGIVAGLIADK